MNSKYEIQPVIRGGKSTYCSLCNLVFFYYLLLEKSFYQILMLSRTSPEFSIQNNFTYSELQKVELHNQRRIKPLFFIIWIKLPIFIPLQGFENIQHR